MDNKFIYKTGEQGIKYVPKYDLHGCSKKQAYKEVNNVILKCSELEISSVNFITGKGNHQNINGERAVLFKTFPEWLNDPKLSSLIKDCVRGDGSYKVYLKIEENKTIKNAKKNKNNVKKIEENKKDVKEIKKNVKVIKENKKVVKEINDVKEIKENKKDVKEIKKNVKVIKENKKVVKEIKENKKDVKEIKKNVKVIKENKKVVKEIKENKKDVKEIKGNKKDVKENKKGVKEIKEIKKVVQEIKENKDKKKVKKNKKKKNAKNVVKAEIMEKKFVETNDFVTEIKTEPKTKIFTKVLRRLSASIIQEQFSSPLPPPNHFSSSSLIQEHFSSPSPPPSPPPTLPLVASNNNETSTIKPVKSPHFSQYYFNTYKVVKDLEVQGFTRGQAESIMRGMEAKLINSSENSLTQREVTSLDQKLHDDIGKMKHLIQLDINDYKADIREEQKKLEIKIQEINNKFTITYGDIRTDVEALKWEITRMALMGIFGSTVFALGVMFFISYKKSKEISTKDSIKNTKANNGSTTNEILLNY
ncbi:568_t:CDS:2 [Funneliformis geosporum]|nr:568_t:CDS:2 [Funneliformis geosporum]